MAVGYTVCAQTGNGCALRGSPQPFIRRVGDQDAEHETAFLSREVVMVPDAPPAADAWAGP